MEGRTAAEVTAGMYYMCVCVDCSSVNMQNYQRSILEGYSRDNIVDGWVFYTIHFYTEGLETDHVLLV